MKIKILIGGLLLSLILLAVMCKKSNTTNVVVEQIDSILNEHYTDDAPGCALLITKGDSVIYKGVRGIADVNTKEKITLNTVFNIASISKQFTATGVLKLQEQGKLNIEDSVAKYIPEFKSDIWKKVKLKHLMSHCSGVPDKRPRIDKDFMLYIVDEQCLEYMVDLDELKFEPGTNYDYINPTFQILAEVIKRVSGTTFEHFQAENIFTPAKMTNVRYYSPDIDIPQMAHGYINTIATEKESVDSDSKKDRGNLEVEYVDSTGKMWTEFDYGEETFFGTKADGGIYTSVNDFIKWEKALAENLVINEKSREDAYKEHIQVSGSEFSSYQNRPNTSYGYGWFIDNKPGRERKIYHTGDNGGFQAYAAKYPESGINIIMFENRNDMNRWEMQEKIESILMKEGLILKK